MFPVSQFVSMYCMISNISIAIMQAAVPLKPVEMEVHQLQEGNDMSLHPDISPSVLIATGIDLESEQ